MRYMLFTLPNCLQSKTVREFLGMMDVEFEHIDASTEKGMELVQKYGIGKVPTLLVLDTKGAVRDTACGFEEVQALLDHS